MPISAHLGYNWISYNPVFISGNYTVLALFFCSLGGFAFAKYNFPGRKWLFALMLGTMMVPGSGRSNDQRPLVSGDVLWRERCFEQMDFVLRALFRQLYERVLPGIFWTQITEGDVMGATHERIADPWLARDDYGEADFNSLGTIYMGEQSLDCMLQMVEMWRNGSFFT